MKKIFSLIELPFFNVLINKATYYCLNEHYDTIIPGELVLQRNYVTELIIKNIFYCMRRCCLYLFRVLNSGCF